ncbi:MAG: helix-turn-helix domain-containing protein, partial [Myxococcales bacterium]
MRFSKGFKAQAVRRMLEGKSATALAKEMEVSQSTLSRWLREALK